MCKFLLILLFLGGIFLEVFAQSGVTSKTEAVKFEQDKDTVWIVNDEYNPYKTSLLLKLNFSKANPQVTGVNWGDRESDEYDPVSGLAETEHEYEGKGLYDLRLTDTEGNTHHYMVFNKPLTIDFEIVPSPFKRCIEIDGDSLLIIRKGRDQNMPETRYDVIVDDPGGLYEDRQVVKNKEEIEWQNDSAWVVFEQGTGVNTCRIYIEMTYEDEENKIKLKEVSETDRKISVYQVPDVKKIFGFEDPDQEEIEGLSSDLYMDVCTSNGQDYLKYDESALMYFQCKEGSKLPQPYYNSVNDHTEKFEIRYYYSDTIYEAMPKEMWREVTGMADTVSVTSEIDFKIPGYYKMMITAQNECNVYGEVKVDTLFTELLSGSEKKRYFRVYSSDTAKIVCRTDTLCRNRTNEIKIVDYNVRRGYDRPPVYSFSAPDLDIMNNATIRDTIYKRGRPLTNSEDIQNLGCDSTVITITLTRAYTGLLNLTVTRETCTRTSRNFLINVGSAPEVEHYKFYKNLYDYFGGEVVGNYEKYKHCDTFRYNMPLNLLCEENHTKGFALDSVYFYIKQGNGPEDSLIYRQTDSQSSLTYLFDSTEVESRVRIRAYNACGLMEDALKVQVHSKPRLSLLRDSVPENDSLCVKMDYPYYWGWNGQGEIGEIFSWNILSSGGMAVTEGGYSIDLDPAVMISNGTKIRYPAVGNYEEKFHISHKAMPSCDWDTTLSVVILQQPDTLLYTDSVPYCMASPELNLKKLFGKEEPVFKWGEWKLNAGEVKRERFPEYTLTGQTDTLRYKLLQSTGCYREGKLLLLPKKKPELELDETARYCLPATIRDLKGEDFVQKILYEEGDYQFKAYKNDVAGFNVRKDSYKLGEDKDLTRLIYEIEIKSTKGDTALMGKCRLLRDTVNLDISKPKLEVLKNDTLKYPWTQYNFEKLRDSFVGTAHFDENSLQWRLIPEGTDCGTGLYDGAYTLTDADKNKDTLKFEVSARNYCGDVLKDTLYVEMIRLKIRGYKDTICSNEEGYSLWNEKVQASYANESSVTWEIVYPLGDGDDFTGVLIGTGTDVKYKPGSRTDSVRIWFEAALEGVPAEKMHDTVVLKVNHAPIFEIKKDTLWACNKIVQFDQISTDYINKAHTSDIIGYYVSESGKRLGEWKSGTKCDYTFDTVHLNAYNSDLFQRVEYVAKGYPGCQEVRDTVVLAQPVPAKVEFKRTREEMCAKDSLKLDTLYTVTGEDPFVRYAWSLSGKREGYIENGYYVANHPEDSIQNLRVVTHKEYTCYDGNTSGRVQITDPVSLPLTVHREPRFNVVHPRDTLCRNVDAIFINRNWVSVEKGLYPDYQDSVRVNGIRLSEAGIDWNSVGGEGSLEKLVVTVSQGRCDKWSQQSDTIYLYHLPKMLDGNFSVEDVCEGERSEIYKQQNFRIHPLAKVEWSATGGSIEEEGDKLWFSAASDVMDAAVALSVTPPKDCPSETMKVPVVIGRKPRLQTKAYKVCRLEGQTQTISVELKDSTVTRIDWYRCGTPDEYIRTTRETDWELRLTDTDVQQPDGLCLEARITGAGACQGEFKDTVRISWQEQPTIEIIDSSITVCQADSDGVDLSVKVRIRNADGESWTLQTEAAGSMSGSRFYPGEYSGTANVQVMAPGLSGCPDGNWPVPVTVKAAPKSGIEIEGENCTRRQVEMRPVSNQAQSYEWDFGDGAPQLNGGTDPVSHLYDVAGTYRVVMTATFNNGCPREESVEWTVHPTPQAAFHLPEYVPVAPTVVELLSTSSPDTVICQWKVDSGVIFTGSRVPYHFTAAGDHSVQLVVTAPEGCTDTMLWSGRALEKPKAEFSVEVDSCGGEVRITNLSVVERPDTIEWDFGNGRISPAETPPDVLSYLRSWSDTTYVIRLRLTNISGSDEHVEYVKMISQLKAGFEEWKTTGCEKAEKQIRILTKGKVDTTGIDWGDGTPAEIWSGNGVNILTHDYPENETSASHPYMIQLRVKNACGADTAKKIITVIPQQRIAKVTKVDSMPGNVNECSGDWIFENKSFGFLSQGYSCEWNFGDGTSWKVDTALFPRHIFMSPGSYMVRLRVKDDCEERMDSIPVKVKGNDRLDFVFGKDENRLCVGDSIPVWFVQRGEAPFCSLKWTMPDGTTPRNIDTVYYKFSRSGNFSVTLYAEAENCPIDVEKRGKVHRTPDPSISFSVSSEDVKIEDCVTSLELPFRAVNFERGMEGVSIFWDFGDASSSIEETPPVKRFEKAGSYMVRLKMASPEGCVAWDSLSVVAKETPEAKLELERNLICFDGGEFSMTAYNRTEDADSCSFVWFRGGRTISILPDSVRIFFTECPARERISIRADHRRTGCSSWAFDTVVVSPEVKAALRLVPDTVCAGTEVLFEDVSVAEGGTRTLLFDDGSAGQGAEITKYFGQPGKYGYRFLVTNADGCGAEIEDMFQVHSLPAAEFEWLKDNSLLQIEGVREDIVLPPDKDNGGIRFMNASQAPFLDWENRELHYCWDFGDGEVSYEKDPVHLFDNNGFYNVWLHAFSRMGCRDSVSHTVAIEAVKGLYFPNAMIPADPDPGKNRFQPQGIGLYSFTLKIYARTGDCIWQTDKLENGCPAEYWDGTWNGEIVPAGVYTWQASAVFIDGSVRNWMNGSLVVIR